MIASRLTCLDHDRIHAALDGRLAKSDFDAAIAHLDSCDACRSAAEALSDGPQPGSIDRWMLADDEPDAYQQEAACQIALDQLMNDPSASNVTAVKPQPLPLESLGPYRLLELIGSGGMGAVYLAQHERLKRRCAIKLLPPERVNQPGWLERFDREMTTIASLEHPHVVHATDAGHEAGWHYLVMEYLDGLDVGRVARRMGPLEIADACEIVRQAALGLAHIHGHGLVHRDIKPSNLMLTRQGAVKLLDLGLVLAGDDPLAIDERLTTVGHVMGTMPYMAPEQLADSRIVRPQSDIYSLGATLYRLIAGHPPHRVGRGLAAQVLAITNNDAEPLDRVREDVNSQLVALVARMLSRDPAQRPASAEEVAEQLQSASEPSRLKQLIRVAIKRPAEDDAIRSGLLPSVAPHASRNRTRRPPNRRKRWLMGAAAAAAMLLAAIVIKIQTDRGELIIHSPQGGLVLAIKQGEKLVERLVVESGADQRQILRKGTYSIEIEGGGKALVLSENVVTIDRGGQTSVQVLSPSSPDTKTVAETPASPETLRSDATLSGPLFQGHDLRHWLTVLQRERNGQSLGEATLAAEILSRDADAELRRQAAEETVALARRWGGFAMGSKQDSDPSHAFMAYFVDAFSSYFPEPGIDILYEELAVGNARSKPASVWAFHNFLGGVHGDAERPALMEEVQRWADDVSSDPMQVDRLLKLRDRLLDAADDATGGSLANSTALELTLLAGKSAAEDERLKRHVIQQVEMAMQNSLQPGDAYAPGFRPSLSESYLIAATEIAQHDESLGSQDVWNFLAEALLYPSSYTRSNRLLDTIDAIQSAAPQRLVEVINGALGSRPSYVGGMMGYSGGMMGGMGGGMTGEMSAGYNPIVMEKLLPFYAHQTQDIMTASGLLKELAKSLNNGMPSLKAAIEEAQEILRMRMDMDDNASVDERQSAQEPVAMVKTENGFFPISSSGLHLSNNNITTDQVRQYLQIDIGGLKPTGSVGAPYGYKAVTDAAKIADAIRDVWRDAPLHTITVD